MLLCHCYALVGRSPGLVIPQAPALRVPVGVAMAGVYSSWLMTEDCWPCLRGSSSRGTKEEIEGD